jgi:hypothetical protein
VSTEPLTAETSVVVDQSLGMAQTRVRKAAIRLAFAQSELEQAEREHTAACDELTALEASNGD